MNLAANFTFNLIQRLDNPGVDLVMLPWLQRLFGRDASTVSALIAHPAWQARWVACQSVAHQLPAEEAWTLLLELASDAERAVREGAAHGLGELLAQNPTWLERYQLLLQDSTASAQQKRAILYSAVVLARTHPQLIDLTTALITTAAEQPVADPFRTIGSNLIQTELPKVNPQVTGLLKAEWAHSGNANLRYHAARAVGLDAKSARSAEMSDAAFPNVWSSTAELPIPDTLIDQVIGQERALEIVRLAARQRRFVLMIGDPGTGKSMLAQAMAQMLPAEGLEDIVSMPNPMQPVSPQIRRLPGGTAPAQVAEAKASYAQAQMTVNFLWGVIFVGLAIAGAAYSYSRGGWILPAITFIVLALLLWVRPRLRPRIQIPSPKILVHNPIAQGAPFVDATGFHAGALLGDVRHDPFQSGGRESSPHELVEAGAIHLAHGGVLFVDEVSTLGIESQQQLLTAIQQKQLAITGRSPGSSGSMVRSAAAPCDFVLVIAGNMEDVQKMHPALRSRIRGYGYEIVTAGEMADTPENRNALAQFVAQEVRTDGKIPHFGRAAVDAVIEQAAERAPTPEHLTLHLRELGGLVRAAGDIAIRDGAPLVEVEHVLVGLEHTKSLEAQMNTDKMTSDSTNRR